MYFTRRKKNCERASFSLDNMWVLKDQSFSLHGHRWDGIPLPRVLEACTFCSLFFTEMSQCFDGYLKALKFLLLKKNFFFLFK